MAGVSLLPHLHLGHLADAFYPKRFIVIHTYIHTLMVAAAMQGADQRRLGFSVLLKDTLTCRTGESNQRRSDNKMLPLPLS